MIDTIYIEEGVEEHPKVQAVLRKMPKASLIPIEHYGEVFNRKQQDFRIQKRKPALILAQKRNRLVLPTPDGFGIGGQRNYYFSHLLNCIYDCRYCFLQGMYRSANYVLFVNYEDFETEIRRITKENEGSPTYFFSGYDSDSLALEHLTGFGRHFLPVFEELEGAILELRTKSIAIQSLLKYQAQPNVVVAFSLSPEAFAAAFDEKAPALRHRLRAIKTLADAGWKIGLRLDPLLYAHNWQSHYDQLLNDLEALGVSEHIHSISTGPLRFPKQMHKQISSMYPDSKLFASPFREHEGTVSYPPAIEDDMKGYVHARLSSLFGSSRVFHCQNEGGEV